MRMALRMSPDQALDSLVARNMWLLLKVPLLLYLVWAFFLPGLWKIALLLIASVACAFVSPCIVGDRVNDFQLWFMVISQALVLWIVFWYVAYVLAYLQRNSFTSRLVGACGVLLSPVVVIGAALLVGLVGMMLGIPHEDFWAFFDRWTPVESWRVMHER